MTVEIEINPNSNTNSNPFCKDFDHIVFYVTSPKLVANYFVKLFGFKHYAYKGLETGSRDISSTVIKNNNVIFVLTGVIRPLHKEPRNRLIDSIHHHIAVHGDGVKDVAFKSDNLDSIVDNLISKNSTHLLINKVNDLLSYSKITEVNDKFGTLKYITINGINDTIHTIIDRSNYKGFLPGYELIDDEFQLKPLIELGSIDHCVQNQDWDQMISTCQFYKDYFSFHKFWSVDENQVFTEYSALHSTVMASENEIVKMPVNEPAIGLKKSQIEEFIEFNNGPGIQHIAIKVDNIIDSIKKMKDSGVEFINVPDSYYENIEKKLKLEKHPKIKESLKSIKKLGILIDFDENGYLLQLFTKPIFERPTFFFEIIQRSNHNGFGAGNFKGLFEVLEKDQEMRGNLTDQDIEHKLEKHVIEETETPKKKIKPVIKEEITDDDIADAINYLA
ncbi:hypothetical protein DAPK24_002080 [Pichia kluyveri]|uniref:4-hydroxyphenylpyruvate dioxygenase n=1 Tax=Pichia kluyveri TaxID=36015 RepID=A0AAV5QXX3_PICKL|nr:hypothetical protein DAPK24_002080 [Pichia kluyveri]